MVSVNVFHVLKDVQVVILLLLKQELLEDSIDLNFNVVDVLKELSLIMENVLHVQ